MSRAWIFTYNNPVGDLDTNYDDLRYATWQLECGEGGTYHFQGVAEFKKPKRLAAVKKWLPTAHWEPRRGSADEARNYANKEDTRIAGPWSYGEPGVTQGRRVDLDAFRDAVLGGASDEQLLLDHVGAIAKYPRLASTIRRTLASSNATKVTITEPTTWQRAALTIAAAAATVRTVHWFVDSAGNGGKTYLCKHLMHNNNAFYSVGGKHADILFAYQGEGIVCFDFPRSSEEFVCYSVIEALKNGVVTISKYESQTFVFPVPIVFVFSNFEPDRSKLSLDRWDVHYILNNL
jgi:hypothetical protein